MADHLPKQTLEGRRDNTEHASASMDATLGIWGPPKPSTFNPKGPPALSTFPSPTHSAAGSLKRAQSVGRSSLLLEPEDFGPPHTDESGSSIHAGGGESSSSEEGSADTMVIHASQTTCLTNVLRKARCPQAGLSLEQLASSAQMPYPSPERSFPVDDRSSCGPKQQENVEKITPITAHMRRHAFFSKSLAARLPSTPILSDSLEASQGRQISRFAAADRKSMPRDGTLLEPTLAPLKLSGQRGAKSMKDARSDAALTDMDANQLSKTPSKKLLGPIAAVVKENAWVDPAKAHGRASFQSRKKDIECSEKRWASDENAGPATEELRAGHFVKPEKPPLRQTRDKTEVFALQAKQGPTEDTLETKKKGEAETKPRQGPGGAVRVGKSSAVRDGTPTKKPWVRGAKGDEKDAAGMVESVGTTARAELVAAASIATTPTKGNRVEPAEEEAMTTPEAAKERGVTSKYEVLPATPAPTPMGKKVNGADTGVGGGAREPPPSTPATGRSRLGATAMAVSSWFSSLVSRRGSVAEGPPTPSVPVKSSGGAKNPFVSPGPNLTLDVASTPVAGVKEAGTATSTDSPTVRLDVAKTPTPVKGQGVRDSVTSGTTSVWSAFWTDRSAWGRDNAARGSKKVRDAGSLPGGAPIAAGSVAGAERVAKVQGGDPTKGAEQKQSQKEGLQLHGNGAPGAGSLGGEGQKKRRKKKSAEAVKEEEGPRWNRCVLVAVVLVSMLVIAVGGAIAATVLRARARAKSSSGAGVALPPDAPADRTYLPQNITRSAGVDTPHIVSQDGWTALSLEADGSLQLLSFTPPYSKASPQLLWSSGSAGLGVQRMVLDPAMGGLVLQTDSGMTVWQSGFEGDGLAYPVVAQVSNDAQLQLASCSSPPCTSNILLSQGAYSGSPGQLCCVNGQSPSVALNPAASASICSIILSCRPDLSTWGSAPVSSSVEAGLPIVSNVAVTGPGLLSPAGRYGVTLSKQGQLSLCNYTRSQSWAECEVVLSIAAVKGATQALVDPLSGQLVLENGTGVAVAATMIRGSGAATSVRLTDAAVLEAIGSLGGSGNISASDEQAVIWSIGPGAGVTPVMTCCGAKPAAGCSVGGPCRPDFGSPNKTASWLPSGRLLLAGDPSPQLLSPSGFKGLALDATGNLALFDYTPPGNYANASLLWASSTSGMGVTSAILNASGLFLLQHADGTAAWQSETGSVSRLIPPPVALSLSDSGTLDLLPCLPSGNTTCVPVWQAGQNLSSPHQTCCNTTTAAALLGAEVPAAKPATATCSLLGVCRGAAPSAILSGVPLVAGMGLPQLLSPDGSVGLVFLADGSLVLQNYSQPFWMGSPGVIWLAGSGGRGAVRATVKADVGALVLQAADNSSIWQSGTGLLPASPASIPSGLRITNDGRLELFACNASTGDCSTVVASFGALLSSPSQFCCRIATAGLNTTTASGGLTAAGCSVGGACRPDYGLAVKVPAVLGMDVPLNASDAGPQLLSPDGYIALELSMAGNLALLNYTPPYNRVNPGVIWQSGTRRSGAVKVVLNSTAGLLLLVRDDGTTAWQSEVGVRSIVPATMAPTNLFILGGGSMGLWHCSGALSTCPATADPSWSIGITSVASPSQACCATPSSPASIFSPPGCSMGGACRPDWADSAQRWSVLPADFNVPTTGPAPQLLSPDGYTGLMLDLTGNMALQNYTPPYNWSNPGIIWSSATAGLGASYLVLQGSTGLLLLVRPNGTVVWQSETGVTSVSSLKATALVVTNSGRMAMSHLDVSNAGLTWWAGVPAVALAVAPASQICCPAVGASVVLPGCSSGGACRTDFMAKVKVPASITSLTALGAGLAVPQLLSPDGYTGLSFDLTGNLLLLDYKPPSTRDAPKVVWQSATATLGATRAGLDAKTGALALRTTTGLCVWSTVATVAGVATTLAVTNYQSLELQAAPSNSSGVPLVMWSANSLAFGRSTLKC